MRILPRSRRGTWLLAGVVWLAACGGQWWAALPVVPYRVIGIDPPFWTFDFTPDSAEIVTFSGPFDPTSNSFTVFPGQLRYWKCSTGEQIGDSINLNAELPAKPFSADRRWWTFGSTGYREEQPRLLDIANRRIETLELGPTDRFPSGRVSADGRFGLFQAPKWTAVLWDFERCTSKTLASIRYPFAFSTDGGLIAGAESSDWGRTAIRILERLTGREIATLPARDYDHVNQLEISPDGAFAIAMLCETPYVCMQPSIPCSLRCWEIRTGVRLFSIPWDHRDHFEFTRDGKTLVIARHEPGDHRLEWRETSTGEIVRLVPVGGELAQTNRALTMSPDGNRIAVERISSQPGIIEQWADRFGVTWPLLRSADRVDTCIFDVHTCELQHRIPAQEPRWSPDNHTLATAIGPGPPFDAIGLWNIPPRKPMMWFAAGAALLALPIAWLARRRVRSLRFAAA